MLLRPSYGDVPLFTSMEDDDVPPVILPVGALLLFLERGAGHLEHYSKVIWAGQVGWVYNHNVDEI
ncbi:MAG: hypothetical protein EBT03_13175 [Betaproteobacteria bacterium]|nr:hypothetical protein [Betaproteobacteria bacterium]